jgi:hypothetical protein
VRIHRRIKVWSNKKLCVSRGLSDHSGPDPTGRTAPAIRAYWVQRGLPAQQTPALPIRAAWEVLLIYEGIPFLGANMNSVPIRS